MKITLDIPDEYQKQWEAIKDQPTFITKALDNAKEYGNQRLNNLFKEWEEIVGFPVKSKMTNNRRAAYNLSRKYDEEQLTKLLRAARATMKDQFAPRISDFTELQAKLNQLVAWSIRQQPDIKHTVEDRAVNREVNPEGIARLEKMMREKGLR